jgi:hypothetical protein
MKPTRTLLIALLAVAGVAGAQGLDDSLAPADLGGADEDFVDPAGSALSPEEMQTLIAQAGPMLLEQEREAAIREIEDGLLFDPERIDLAVAHIGDDPQDTPADNIERIITAFAMVDQRFSSPVRAYRGEDYDAAAMDVRAIINPAGAGYLDAAKRLIHAESLRRLGRDEDALEAYAELLDAMADKVSFASTAALRTGEVYEAMGRRLYAGRAYALWLKHYGFLDEQLADELHEKVQQIQSEYEDPLGTLADRMAEVGRRLDESDSGAETQQREQQIVGMLGDLIASIEDSQGGGGGGGGGGGAPGSSSGQSSGASNGQGNASNPRQQSVLPGDGQAVRPQGQAAQRTGGDDGAWGALPPRQREQLLEAFRQQYPDRYAEIVERYYRRLAEQP